MATNQDNVNFPDLVMCREPTTHPMWRGLWILLRGLTQTGVVLLLFVPGVRVEEYRSFGNYELFTIKFRNSKFDFMGTVWRGSEYIILWFNLI